MDTSNRAIQFLLQRAGSVYTAGPTVENALSICRDLAAQGIASTVCYWNISLDPPSTVLDRYLQVLQCIQDLPADCYLSIKAPSLSFDAELVKRILFEAQRKNTCIHFDAMAPETVDRTFDLIERARQIYPNLGCTLPSRWRRSMNDVNRAIDLGLRVRIVKGQWSGLNGDETDSTAGFLRLAESLIAKGARHVAVATHNIAVASETLTKLKSSSTSCELELLHRLPLRRIMKIARLQNIRTRIYVPYGHGALPYRLREIGRDPRILAWFMRDLIRSTANSGTDV